MKGTGRSYGFDAPTEHWRAMENSAKAANILELNSQLGDLQEYLRRVGLRPLDVR